MSKRSLVSMIKSKWLGKIVEQGSTAAEAVVED